MQVASGAGGSVDWEVHPSVGHCQYGRPVAGLMLASGPLWGVLASSEGDGLVSDTVTGVMTVEPPGPVFSGTCRVTGTVGCWHIQLVACQIVPVAAIGA